MSTENPPGDAAKEAEYQRYMRSFERVRQAAGSTSSGQRTECPGCHVSPPIYRTLADLWERHDICPECGYCYTHGETDLAGASAL